MQCLGAANLNLVLKSGQKQALRVESLELDPADEFCLSLVLPLRPHCNINIPTRCLYLMSL